MLKSNRQVARAVAAILGTQAAGFGVVAHAADQSDTASIESIQEVVVTAQRRTENAQDVPIAVQVFSGE
jgi:iron complex outermembrane recepter protein